MTTIILDGLNEEDFRRSIENRLREGSYGAAIARLRSLIAPYAGPGGILPERFLTVEAADLVLIGWDALGDAVRRRDMPGRRVTALSIAFAWPGEDVPQPDAEGLLRPHIETSYFSDNAFPFSQSGRDDLLEGYSFYGCTWSGDCEASDTALSLAGIDDLHGALAGLEAQLLASDEPDEDGIRAGSLGACLLSALLVQAVSERVARDELPRPLCVMAGSSGVYPYFDAPVAGIQDSARKAAAAEVEVFDMHGGAPAPRYSSLLMTGIPRAKKRAVLVLDENEDELASRIAKLRNLGHPDGEDEATRHEAVPAADEPAMPDPATAALTGGPLLAKKPPRQSRDLYDIFGLHIADPSVSGSSPREQAASAEPVLTLPPPRPSSEGPLGPGFTMLEPHLQHRLQTILSADPPPIAGAPWLAPFSPADQPLPLDPVDPHPIEDSGTVQPLENPPEALPASPVTQPDGTGFLARLSGRFKAWLARFGR